ncbi:MAG: hypothetical protein K2X70_14530 [Candidatus Obscuribacterales bacterium]|nr:hypothetical protein [Candidatus Obscuribacterales bacterium]
MTITSSDHQSHRPNPFVAVSIGLFGAVLIIGLSYYFFAPTPYLFRSLDQYLDKSVRQPKSAVGPSKSVWPISLEEEQMLWQDELTKVKLNLVGAKPLSHKRDLMLYLADAYYRHPQTAEQAKSLYQCILDEPVLPHEHAYVVPPSYIKQRIGLMAYKQHRYAEAEKYLRQALEGIGKTNLDKDQKQVESGIKNDLRDRLARVLIIEGKLPEAESIIEARRKEIGVVDLTSSVENLLVLNAANLALAKKDLPRAGSLFETINRNFAEEEDKRKIAPFSPQDNDRLHAEALIDYARYLRSPGLSKNENRAADAFEAMRRAYHINEQEP